MEEIMEQFGLCILEMIPVGLLLSFFLSMMSDGGILHMAVQWYMSGLCG